jgi:hypothetical protein
MITLGNQGGEHISIGPIGCISHEGWFQSPVEIIVNGFEGNINPYFEIQDIIRFHDELQKLYDTLEGVVELKPIEGQFGFTLTADRKGHIEVKGFAYTHATYGSCLKFEFDLDQTYLPTLIRSLNLSLNENALNI